MNAKNRLIEKLLKVAKAHKILTYPVLALVAIISVISYFFSWSTGAGKRIVAIIMVMVMLVSQSYFLTSSATALVDDENAALVQKELQEKLIEEETKEETKVTTEAAASVSTETAAATTEADTELINDDPGIPAIENVTDEDTSDTEVTDTDTEGDIFEEELDSKLGQKKQIQYTFKYPQIQENGTTSNNTITTGYVDSNEDISADAGMVYTYNISSYRTTANDTLKKAAYSKDGCYEYSEEWYYDSSYTNKVENFESVEANASDGYGNPIIQLYCKLQVVKYKVTVDNDDDDGTVLVPGDYTSDAASRNGNTHYVAVTENGTTKTARLTLSGFNRTGYSIAGASVVSGGGTAQFDSINKTITCSFSGNICEKKVWLHWKANPYKIRYAYDNTLDSEIIKEQEVTYDGQEGEKFIDGKDITAKKEGYKFSSWTIGINGTEVKPGSPILAAQSLLYPDNYPQEESDIKILYPKYVYDGVEITQDTVGLEYKKPEEPLLIHGYYGTNENKEGSENFSYDILSGVDVLSAYGINAEATDSGILITTNGPNSVTTNSIELSFKITDPTAPAAPVDQRETIHTVKINVAPRTIEIKSPMDGSEVKVYDGNTSTKAEFSNKKFKTNVDGIEVSFNESHYEDPNAGKDKKIILGDVTWHIPENESESNYNLKLDENYVLGEITPRTVFVRTYIDWGKSKRKYVRAGEANPVDKFRIEEVTYGDTDTGFIGDDSINDLGEISYSAIDGNGQERQDLEAEGLYYIIADTAKLVNYEIKIEKDDVGSFEVIKEFPEEGKYYEIDGTQGKDKWYIEKAPQIVIKSGVDYDTVRISTDGGKNWTESSKLPDGNYTEDELYIQLYDSATNAITKWAQIYVKVDTEEPEYVSYILTQGDETLYNSTGDGLYFPSEGMVSFGNYFNTTVSVTIKFKDTASGLTYLHYGLFGEGSGMNARTFGPTDEEGYATATIDIYKGAVDKIGEIKFYAEDRAGNKSAETKLIRGNAGEWSVETTGPKIEDFYVEAGDEELRAEADEDSEYYSSCKAVLSAKDTMSGIRSVAWYVNGKLYAEEKADGTKKQGQYTFNKEIRGSGECKIHAVVTDNAGNETQTPYVISLHLDDDPPVINITSSENDTWQTSVRIEFNTYDKLSGVEKIEVMNENGDIINHHVKSEKDGTYYCYFDTAVKGKYSIVVTDKAGNVSTKEIDLQNVSDEVPACPQISFSPETADGNDGWYTTAPSFNIGNVTETTDGTPVTTKYQLWKEGETASDGIAIPAGKASLLEQIPDDGIYNLNVWSKSITGVQCEGKHQYQLKVDTVLPQISFSTSKGSGSTLIINFTVADSGSGIDTKTIKVLRGTTELTAEIEQTDTGYTGSCEISQTGNYTIQVSDIAGNAAKTAAFSPMSMKVKAVTNISTSAATVRANVIKGTFDITAVSLAYREYAESQYTAVDALTTMDENGNVALSAVLDNLKEGTAYAYKITAVSSGNEVLEYEGYFKTLSSAQTGISIYGTARYANNREGNITVGIFSGSTCIMAKEVNAGEEFVFNNIPDGNYSIVATDGVYSKTMRVLIQDGLVIYPQNYIELVLSGKNTSVVITTDETPHITADNMDSIFDNDTVNFTDKDEALIESGGTVEFKLYATLMSISSVSASEITAMYAVTDQNKVVGAYLDLSLYKIVTDADGYVERTRVTNLANGANISVTIPLGDLAGKPGLEVVRIHNDGENFIGASLTDQDNNPSTYTVTTNQFSTYAVLYSRGAEETTTTTEEIKDGTSDPSTNGKINITSEDPDVDPDNGKSTDEEKEPDDKTPAATQGTSVGSLRSSGSAKTGDETPVAVMGCLMLLSMGGFFFLRRKIK